MTFILTQGQILSTATGAFHQLHTLQLEILEVHSNDYNTHSLTAHKGPSYAIISI